jgi:hypothetical protein
LTVSIATGIPFDRRLMKKILKVLLCFAIVTYTGTTKRVVGITNVNLARLKTIVDCLTQQHE